MLASILDTRAAAQGFTEPPFPPARFLWYRWTEWPVWRCCSYSPQEAGTHGPSARLPVVIYNFSSLLSLVNNLVANTSLVQGLPTSWLSQINPTKSCWPIMKHQTAAETKSNPSRETFILTKDVGWLRLLTLTMPKNVTNAVFGAGRDSVFYLKECATAELTGGCPLPATAAMQSAEGKGE